MNITLDIANLKEYRVSNYLNPETSALVAPLLKNNSITENNVSEIASICNQKDVYNLLFEEKLNGEKYSIEKARSFIDWANEGWKNKTHFVYIIKTSDNKVIGAIDIKSNNQIDAEIGYWMDENTPGFMTNVVIGLTKQAKEANFKSLVAYTKFENEKSKNVLLRAGFSYLGQEIKKNGNTRDKFKITLS